MARTALIARRGFLGIVAGLLAVGGTRRSVSVAAAHPAATPDRQAASLGRVAMRSAQDRAVLSETTRMAAGSPLEELLRFIPDTSAHRRYLTLSDVELAARRVGAQPPPDHADQTAVYAYARALFDVGMLGGPFISGLGEDIAVEPSRRPYLAFGVGNVSQTALTGTPPRQTELIFGRFDPSATDAALSACADCTPPARETHQGVPFYAWGNDFEQDFSGRFKPPAHDALGRGGRIAVQPRFAYRTLWTEGMQAAIETSLGVRPSLADVPEYAALVAGLAGLGSFSLFLTDDVSNQAARKHADPATVMSDPDETIRRVADPSILLRPYHTLALGVGTDDGGPYMAIGLMHPTEQMAAENVDILPRRIERAPSMKTKAPWSTVFGDVEAHAEQRMLLAKVRRHGGSAYAWMSWWSNYDWMLLYD